MLRLGSAALTNRRSATKVEVEVMLQLRSTTKVKVKVEVKVKVKAFRKDYISVWHKCKKATFSGFLLWEQQGSNL